MARVDTWHPPLVRHDTMKFSTQILRVTALLAMLATATPGMAEGNAEENSLKEGAREVGRAVGSAAREVGQGAKKVGKAIGHAAREGFDAVREGAREAKKAMQSDK